MKQLIKWPVRTMLAGLLLMMGASAWAESAKATTAYDKVGDRLSVTVEDVSFTGLMARIASLTGLEILMDPKAEHNISINLSDMPLEKALKQIARETSYVFVYDRPKSVNKESVKKAAAVLVSMHILPKGEHDNDGIRPLLGATGEAFIREKDRYAEPEHEMKIFNHAQKRWDARLKNMPAERREALLKSAEEKREKVAKQQAKRAQRKIERDEKRKKSFGAQRRAENLERLKTSNPEEYEIRMQRNEERMNRQNKK